MRPTRGWVLYDDDCGFCSRWVRFWAATLRRRGFEVAPLQESWVRDRIRHGHLLDDLRLLHDDGQLTEGADVYRYLMRRIWWAYPAYWLSTLPFLRDVFDATYRSFATNRYRVSRSCGLKSTQP